ncbi:MAG: methylmalonyl-CoA carboxyltransferase [Firmicutes bacterium]|nr:methylmalonyl-CoA carboxyltransferase [Bacillota bacterium]
MDDRITDLEDRKARIERGGGDRRILAQHEKGKYTARERIEMLLDAGTFREIGAFIEHRGSHFGMDQMDAPAEGVVTGWGEIAGRTVYVFAQDFTVFGGALGEMHGQKIARIMDLAAQNGAPIIGLNDSGGARIQEGVVSLDGYGHVFYRNAIYSGVVPQISVIMGPCAGGAVYSPAITDFIFMVEKTSQMFITGPKVIQSVTGEDISSENLGGAKIHSTVSGVAHFIAPSEEQVLADVRTLLTYLPSHHEEQPPVLAPDERREPDEEIVSLVPTDSTKVYDVIDVIKRIVDFSDFLQVSPHFARNAVVGLARMGGHTVGIIANQPKFLAGGLDIDSSDKISRFIRFCDSFSIPLITFEDVTGFIPGVSQEHRGIIRHGAKILYAYSEATVPKITVILRKAYGGAYVALNSKAIGADLVLAWPIAEVAVMGSEGAANVIFAREIAQSADPDVVRAQKIAEYKEKFANPYIAAQAGMIDDVIDPRETRAKLLDALHVLAHKKVVRVSRKHGNMPL